jgi:hypothetical protein
MPSSNVLAIFNPCNYWRGGYVTIPWRSLYQQFQIPAEELVLKQIDGSSRTDLPLQIDRVDPEDPSRDTLVFLLAKPIPPSGENNLTVSAFVEVDRGKSAFKQQSSIPSLEIVRGSNGEERGVRFVNNRLIVWFNLVPAPENDGRNWFAGSATSVQLDHQEILDQFSAVTGQWMNQDPEKRCLQVDRIQLDLKVSESQLLPCYEIALYDRPYQLISHCSGPIRTSITIASEPFDYHQLDPNTNEQRYLKGRLYRILSLYKDADYITEELFIKAKPQEEQDENGSTKQLDFAAWYYAYMDMSQQPQIYQKPNWFAVGSSYEPYAGYGFATNIPIDSTTYPSQDIDRRFSWKLLPAKSIKCLHLFMRSPLKDFDLRTEKYWYELIHKPLETEVYQKPYKKLADVWEQYQKQLGELQKKLVYAWIDNLPTASIQKDFSQTLQKTLDVQQELINVSLKTQAAVSELGVETQKYLWNNYFQPLQKQHSSSQKSDASKV